MNKACEGTFLALHIPDEGLGLEGVGEDAVSISAVSVFLTLFYYQSFHAKKQRKQVLV